MIALFPLLLLPGGAAGAWLLRRSWRRRAGAVPALVWSGWALLVAPVFLAAWCIGPVKGVALALVLEAIGALLVVFEGRVRRNGARERTGDAAAAEPLDEPGRLWRGVLRTVLAGPLGMLAAMAVAFCVTVYVPGDPRTRIVIGGMLMPVLWGLAMTWTLADRRLLRATAVLLGTSVAGFGLALAGGTILGAGA